LGVWYGGGDAIGRYKNGQK